jgi:LysR family transcriptional regulator for metE and metH
MASRLDLRHYETLVAVVETGSVSAAADRLALTQSAVSHRLAEAERRLGHALFERRPARPLLPTPAALALCQSAQRALPELERAESAFVRAGGDRLDIVRLGVGSYDCYHWLPRFHSFVEDRLGQVRLELVVVGSAPATRLSEGAVDVVIAPGQPNGAFESRPLFTDELVLLTHPDHRLAGRAWIEPGALVEETYFTYNRTPVPGFEYDRFIRPADTEPLTVIVIEQTSAIAEMVASGLGVSILSHWAVSPWIANGKESVFRCGRRGLDLEWRSLLRPRSAPGSPEQEVADLLAEWLRAPDPA